MNSLFNIAKPALLNTVKTQATRIIGSTTLNASANLLKRSYHENVIKHYENPQNVGSLPKDDPNVGTGLVGAPACGDVMKLQILVDEETGQIKDVKFKTYGCGSAIASSSFASQKIKGLKVWEAKEIKNQDIARELSLPPVKLHCSMLAEDAIKMAVKDWETKRANKKKGKKGKKSKKSKKVEKKVQTEATTN
jgi:Fe-S cluster assembly scaffold IscU